MCKLAFKERQIAPMENKNVINFVEEAAVAYKSSGEMHMVEAARRGVSKKSLLSLAELSGISVKELAGLLPVSLRTIQRYNDDDLLEPYISEHALNIAMVLAKGLDVFSSTEKLQHWLHTPAVSLGNKKPISLLDTGFGARLLLDELGRLEYGVYS